MSKASEYDQEHTTTVPDLETGFMILNHDRDNRWQTPIEAILSKTTEDNRKEFAYLSHECRSENVDEDPFAHEDSEFLGISTWSGNYLMGSGSSLFKQNPKFMTRKTKASYFVSCEPRTANFIDFDNVLSFLQTDCAINYKPLHMELSFNSSGTRYKLYSRCRYLNFPNPNLTNQRYLQPISGYVLYEEAETFYLAYVVCYMRSGLTKTIQFRLSEQIDYFKTINHPGAMLRSFLRCIPPLLYTRGFRRVAKFTSPEVECRFFVY